MTHGRTHQPLPVAQAEYDEGDELVTRRTIEQNFEDVFDEIADLEADRMFRTVTTSATLRPTDDAVLVDATAGAVTVTLPSAAVIKSYDIKKTDASANAVTIAADGVETIDDSSTATLSSQYDAVRIQADGTEWWIL